jgi:predicted transcriptional regulator
MLRYRAYHVDKEAVKRAKSKVESLIEAMKNLDLDELYTNLKYLENRGENEFKDVKNVVNAFVSTVEKSLEKYKV